MMHMQRPPSPPPQTTTSSSPTRFTLSAFIPRRTRPLQNSRSAPSNELSSPSRADLSSSSPTGHNNHHHHNNSSSNNTNSNSTSLGSSSYFALRRSGTNSRSNRSQSLSNGSSQPQNTSASRPQSSEANTSHNAASSTNTQQQQQPLSADSPNAHYIRIVPHLDLASRSLSFEPLSRSLDSSHPIRIGRFTDRNAPPPNSQTSLTCGRIAFKSKVVSRSHAILSVDRDGEFWLVDTKSSSGTFLNHIRLSGPGHESRPFKVRDGDVIQLGVDYQGGAEEIYRCVKLKVELGRGRDWQRSANSFNTQALQQIRTLSNVNNNSSNSNPSTPNKSSMKASKKKKKVSAVTTSSTNAVAEPATKSQIADDTDNSITDCCICLFAVTVCQSLFIAPCSHCFHYKCIRPLLQMHHPGFSCPLCRTFADLEADVETEVPVLAVEEEEEEDDDEEEEEEEEEDAEEDAGVKEEKKDVKEVKCLSKDKNDEEEEEEEEDHCDVHGIANATRVDLTLSSMGNLAISSPLVGGTGQSSHQNDTTIIEELSLNETSSTPIPRNHNNNASSSDQQLPQEADERRSSIVVLGPTGMQTPLQITGRDSTNSRPASIMPSSHEEEEEEEEEDAEETSEGEDGDGVSVTKKVHPASSSGGGEMSSTPVGSSTAAVAQHVGDLKRSQSLQQKSSSPPTTTATTPTKHEE